jgi:hypothetical protein
LDRNVGGGRPVGGTTIAKYFNSFTGGGHQDFTLPAYYTLFILKALVPGRLDLYSHFDQQFCLEWRYLRFSRYG